MSYAIALTPVIPMRSAPDEDAEMVSQVLFGEHFKILEERPRWYLIEHAFDGECGWIDWKMATLILDETAMGIEKETLWMVRHPVTDIRRKGDKTPIRISMGTVLPGYDPVKSEFGVEDKRFSIPARSVIEVKPSHLKALLRTAELFLNTSYLWGGRNIFGADCSGFVQVVYRLNGINLPRNARQQIAFGDPVESFEAVYPGDLAFFAKAGGKITHVGIVLTPDTIIHCSGDVHIDKLTAEGIWSDKLQCFTHGAPILRRFPQLRKRK